LFAFAAQELLALEKASVPELCIPALHHIHMNTRIPATQAFRISGMPRIH
jgi:hypothetical protein